MLLEIALILIVWILLSVILNRKPTDLPPGEWGLPLVGYLPFLETKMSKSLFKLTRKHGDIFTLKLGSRVCVFISDFNAIKIAFNKPEFNGRPDFFAFNAFWNQENKTYGMISADGHSWETNRRFSLKALKGFGLGKSRMVEDILDEATHLINYYKELVDKPFNVDFSLNVAILNMTFKLVADKRYDIHDEEANHLSELIYNNVGELDGPKSLLNFLPALVPFVPNFIRNNWMKVDTMEKGRDKIIDHLKKLVEEHKQTINPSVPRDFIDMYLVEMAAQKNDPELKFFGERNLHTLLLDLFVAGSDATSTTLRWFFMYMSKYRKIQKKVQQQIDSVVPKSELPSLEYKQSLPLLEALMHEVNRITSLAPLAVPHEVTEHTTLKGYKIPKGTIIFPCIDIVHRNPEFWKHPDELDLDHFLDKDGKFVPKKEGYFPFSTGRRQCAGEPMGKMMLFVFMGAILQNFDIYEPEGQILSFESIETVSINNRPYPFEVILKKRN